MKVIYEIKPCVSCVATGQSLERESYCFCCSGRGYRVVMSTEQPAPRKWKANDVARQSSVNAFPVISFAHLLNSNLRDDNIVRRVEGLAPMVCSFDC